MAMPPIDIPNMTDTQKVLNMIRDAVIGHDTRLQTLRDDLTSVQTDLEVLKIATLTGSPKDKVLSHEERLRSLEAYVDGIKDTIKYWGRVIGGALLLNFIGFTTGILIAVVKFLPVLEKLAASQP